MFKYVFKITLFVILCFFMVLLVLLTRDIEQAPLEPLSIFPRLTIKIRSTRENIVINSSNTVFDTNNYAAVTDKPVLANGHIGYVPYSDSIYMNGLYNGFKGNSHRARIPNYANIYFEQCNGYESNSNVSCTYGLDINHGIFQTHAEFNNGDFAVEQIQYTHRYYDTVIVNQISIKRNTVDHYDNFKLKLSRKVGEISQDLNIRTIRRTRTLNRGLFLVNATTVMSEDPSYQHELPNVNILYERIPHEIELASGRVFRKYVWLTIIDTKDISDLSIYERIHNEHDRLTSLHTNEWTKFWEESGISTEGNDELQKSVQSSLYAIASSLPSLSSYRGQESFFGLSPSGLGLGGPKHEGYQGHSFWDSETWMHPSILLIEPQWSEQLLNYRYMVKQAARENAKYTRYKGLRYPWESAYTGRDVCPDPEITRFEQHITADIGHAVRKHVFATYDTYWLLNGGCELALGIAEFWASRLTYNETKGRYDINDVMGPDEDHSNITNNAFTNVGAALSLYFGDYASCICNKSGFRYDYQQTNWSSIASRIYLPYDEEKDYNPEYDGYTLNTSIKQADVVLLGYPLQYANIEKSTRRNNLKFYTNVTRKSGPAMTWSMHAIGHLDIDEEPSETLFNSTFVPYIRKPFYVWNEYVNGVPNGASNFITGAGGFLQLILYGYAGIRINANSLSIQHPTLPPNTNKLKLNGISYMQTRISMEIEKNSYRIEIKTNNKQTRVFVDGREEEDPTKTIFVLSRTQKVAIKPKDFITKLFESCSLPKDVINQPLN